MAAALFSFTKNLQFILLYFRAFQGFARSAENKTTNERGSANDDETEKLQKGNPQKNGSVPILRFRGSTPAGL